MFSAILYNLNEFTYNVSHSGHHLRLIKDHKALSRQPQYQQCKFDKSNKPASQRKPLAISINMPTHLQKSPKHSPHTNVSIHASHNPRLRPPTHHRPRHKPLQRLTGDRPQMPKFKTATTTGHHQLQVLALLASADWLTAVPRFHTWPARSSRDVGA